MAFASRRFLALAAGRTAVTVLVLINVRDYFFDVHGVYGRSMTPTLSPDYHATGRQDYVLFKKYPMGAWPGLNVSRGDVVSFWKPHAPEELSVKRVIATAGDTVFPRKARSGSEGVEIPYGHVWVEGDNKAETYDSNDFGPVSGRILLSTEIC